MLIMPSVGFKRPAIIERSVDFPQPEGPAMVTNSPFATENDMLLSTKCSPKGVLKLKEMFFISTASDKFIPPMFFIHYMLWGKVG